MSPEVARRVIKLFREIRPPERADYKLTPHELRLLKLIVEGHNYKTAAVALDVKVTTIAFHMRNIYEKLQVHSKSEAVAKALRNRLVCRGAEGEGQEQSSASPFALGSSVFALAFAL